MKPTKNINRREDWRYHTAAETVKPGYLARQFAAYRKREAEAEQERLCVVAKRKLGSKHG